ncbi:flagellin N-terminal helical domain-containing protein [Enterococcus gallinarum]|uniref:flagellin N-terminal helical domain-containing protein n=1 Tax=Enterococcus gallinarum TaxID=1353 RepID=UPI0012E2A9B9|nr:flagellin [Enterococcus gallinarum]MCC4045976.1 flagellin [Enterococcus gallinarum]MUO34353.1 flagellin [Enterococcus gallinarum]
MRINTNVSALNTYSRLTAANASKSNSLSKLSSGMRINKAGDDAAGLAISEKMKGQIGGLSQAKSNAQDGISLIQTAEGALNETHSILGRMRDLAVQSSNGTLSTDDREAISKEFSALSDEIDRISTTTEFNTKSLLKGGESGEKASFIFQIGANANQTMSVKIGDMGAKALGVDALKLEEAKDAESEIAKKVETAFLAGTEKYDADGKIDASGTSASDLQTAIANATDDTAKAAAQKTYDAALESFKASANGQTAIATAKTEVEEDAKNSTVSKIDNAIKAVSAQRADLGAAQNRLEHTINNLGTTQENLSEANSRIRDVDMAQEMMSFTKSNILSQAATSMLAQANSMPNSVLSLLQ